jgi:hypothetical protein
VTAAGQPLEGVAMQLSGGKAARTITDAQGYYRFTGLDSGQFYTVAPARANYTFSPSDRSYSLSADAADATFTANALPQQVANPVDTDLYFVRQQYLDFLGREPDAGGLAYWTNEISRCGSDADCVNRRRVEVSAAFFISNEMDLTGSYVYRLYKSSLGRDVSYNEFAKDRLQVIAGENLIRNKEVFIEDFVNRPEFVDRYSGATDGAAFVDALLLSIKQSSGVDLSGQRTALIAKYDEQRTFTERRAETLKLAIEATAFKQAVYNPSFVLIEYFGYLKRDPEAAGYQFWLNVLNNGDPGNYKGMVCSFITSAEYQARFSSVVTHSNKECGQ